MDGIVVDSPVDSDVDHAAGIVVDSDPEVDNIVVDDAIVVDTRVDRRSARRLQEGVPRLVAVIGSDAGSFRAFAKARRSEEVLSQAVLNAEAP